MKIGSVIVHYKTVEDPIRALVAKGVQVKIFPRKSHKWANIIQVFYHG